MAPDVILEAGGKTEQVSAYDVVVIGGGPAGGHLSRLLAARGVRVMLAERARDFADNDFSSACVPIETLARFDLPSSVIGSPFQRLTLISTGTSTTWESPDSLGVVLDFAGLRRFLANEASRHGARVEMGCRYLGHARTGDGLSRVRLASRDGELSVAARLIVDATGAARAVVTTICDLGRTRFVTATGLEYLIEVDPATYAANASRLTFLLGHRWNVGGYSWIFPMGGNRLKVGAAVYNLPHAHGLEKSRVKQATDLVVREHLGIAEPRILDIHGGVLRFAPDLDDIFAAEGVVAVGDSVSCVNPLGGEGIRHGMECAEIVLPHIIATLAGRRGAMARYRRQIRSKFRWRWKLSWVVARSCYLRSDDKRIDHAMDDLAKLSTGVMMDGLFGYRIMTFGGSLACSWIGRRIRRAFSPTRWWTPR